MYTLSPRPSIGGSWNQCDRPSFESVLPFRSRAHTSRLSLRPLRFLLRVLGFWERGPASDLTFPQTHWQRRLSTLDTAHTPFTIGRVCRVTEGKWCYRRGELPLGVTGPSLRRGAALGRTQGACASPFNVPFIL